MSTSFDSPEDAVEIPASTWLFGFSWGGSLLMHLSALVLMAALILPGQGDEEPSLLGEIATDVAEPMALLEPQLLLPTAAESAAEQPTADQLLTEMAPEQSDLPAAPAHAELALNFGDTAALELAGPLTAKVGSGAAGTASGKGQGTGSGKGKGHGNGKGGSGKGSFFGLSVKGKSTVFVVDASRSMNMLHPGPMRTRFNRVKLELVRTINSMTENERFFVIFFGDGAYPMPADRMMEAEPNVKKRYLSWMAAQQAVGHTFPEQALLLSLQLQPDIIYFLTDGEFDFSVVPGVTAANVRGIPIHTIGFSDNRGENLLMEIARRNNGTYTYIPPDEFDADTGDAGDTAAAIISGLGN